MTLDVLSRQSARRRSFWKIPPSWFMLANILAVSVAIAATTTLVLLQIRTEAVRQANLQQEHGLKTFWELLKIHGSRFRIENDQLYVGDYRINGNYELPDRIKSIYGGTATVFMGNTRVSTNVLRPDGSRATGTKLEGPAYEAIFREGKPFRGRAFILGIPYFTAYDPIRDDRGRVIGALYVGVKESEFLSTYESVKHKAIGIAFLLAASFALLALLLTEQRRRSARAMENQLHFLQVLIDTIPNPIFYKNAEGQYLGCNEAFETFTGTGRRQILGKTVYDLAPRELAESYFRADQELFSSPGIQVYENSVRHADGTERSVIFSKATYADQDGKLGGLVGTILDITPRKETEAAMAEQKRFSDSLVENSTVATFVIDARHRILIWNRACEELTGLKGGDVLGTDDHWRAFYPEKRPCLADLIADGKESLAPEHYSSCGPSPLTPDGLHAEGWYTTLNGRTRYLFFHAAPIRAGSGETVAVIQTLEDLTERKLWEETVRAQQELLGNIVATIPHSVCWKDRNSTYLGCNGNFARQAEIGVPEVIVGRTDHDLGWSREVADFYSQGDKEVMASGTPLLNVEKSLRHHDGRVTTLLMSKVPLRNDRGEVIGLLGVYQDITERKQVEERVKRTVSLLGATLESTADGIMAMDWNHQVTHYNRKFAAMWHLPERDATDPPPPDTLSRILDQLRTPREFVVKLTSLNAHASSRSFDFLELKDGRLVESFSQPQLLDDVIVGRVWSFRDVTDRKRLEMQLRHSQKMEALGTLTGGVAHDFNNILTAIFGYLAIMKTEFLDEAGRVTYIDRTFAAAEKAAELTRSLLTYSRQQPLKREKVDLNDIVVRVGTLLERIIGEQITLTRTLSTCKLPILADGGQIEQILMNLATNGRDAMETGGELFISTDQVELDNEFIETHGYGQAGKFALLSVSDTGTGMNEETVERAFEPYFTTKETGKGTGLGLAITYGIVKQHNGYINVYSEVGKGSTFRVYLPVSDAGDTPAPQRHPAPASTGNETILLVEDNVEVRHLFRDVLTRNGYRVFEAEDGEEAVRIFRDRRAAIQLVIMDVIMPKKNGKEAYEEILAINPRIPAIFSSGYTADILSKNGIVEGATHYIAKPFSPHTLLRAIRAALAGEPAPSGRDE